MADESIRGERDPGRALLAKIRAGQVKRSDVVISAASGDEAALSALGIDKPIANLLVQLGDFADKPDRVPGAIATHALVEYYRTLGYTTDRWGKMVSPDGTRRVNFAQRNIQVFGRKPGEKEWHKRSSRTFSQAVQDILLNTKAVDGLEEKLEKKEEAQKKTRDRKRENDLIFRLAVVMASVEATTEERMETLIDADAPSSVDKRIAANLQTFGKLTKEELTVQGIDANLSSERPPLLVWRSRTPLYQTVRYDKMPSSFSWTEKRDGFDYRVEVVRDRRTAPMARVRVGNVPLDPLTMSVIGEDMGPGKKHGFSATMGRQGNVPFGKISFMLVDGAGDELGLAALRTLLRLFSSYGIESASVTSAGKEDVEFIRWAVERDAISVTRRGDALYLRARAEEDPNQLRLFNGRGRAR